MYCTIQDAGKTAENMSFITNGTRNTKVKISHTHTHIHTLGVGKSAAWGPIHGVRLSSDHSILQIPACNYTGRSDSAIYLLSTNWEDGDDHPQILLSAHHTITYTLTTDYREQSACERETEAPAFTALWAFTTETL